MNLDDALSPTEVVDILLKKGVEVSERTLKERARKIGAYRKLGQAMFFLPEDLDKIMEPQQCSSRSKGRKARTTSRGGRSTANASKNPPVKLPSQQPGKPANASPLKSSQVIPIKFLRED